jgi:hypothetical protein
MSSRIAKIRFDGEFFNRIGLKRSLSSLPSSYAVCTRLSEDSMLYLHCTQKLLDRLKPEVVEVGSSTTTLGSWYATVLQSKRQQIAMLVNERTLLPVLMPLAPTTSLSTRFPEALAEILAAHGVPHSFIESEMSQMQVVKYARTQNRSVVGIMTQFAYLAEGYRAYDKMNDLTALSLKLAHTPCSPLYKGPVFPDRALKELMGDE